MSRAHLSNTKNATRMLRTIPMHITLRTLALVGAAALLSVPSLKATAGITPPGGTVRRLGA